MTTKNEFTVDVEVDQTQNNLKAQVSLQSRDIIGVRYVYTSDIIKELSRQGWSVGDCLSVGRLDNVTGDTLQGNWLFNLGPARTETKNTNTTTNKVDKTEKTSTTKQKESNKPSKPTATTRRRRTTKNTSNK